MSKDYTMKQDFIEYINAQYPSAVGGLSFIEQLRAKKYARDEAVEIAAQTWLNIMSRIAARLCPNPKAPRYIGEHIETGKHVYIKARCKMWACPVCGAANADQWVARIINGINQLGGTWRFLTLTSHEKMRGRERSLKNIRDGWKKLYDRALRKHAKIYGVDKKMHYVKVWEFHKDGTYHLHLLINFELGTRFWKDNARQCGLGYQAKENRVQNAGVAAGYCAKYMAKSIASQEWTKHLRRIQPSHNWPLLPVLHKSSEYIWTWIRDKWALRDKFLQLLGENKPIMHARLGRVLTYDDFMTREEKGAIMSDKKIEKVYIMDTDDIIGKDEVEKIRRKKEKEKIQREKERIANIKAAQMRMFDNEG